uniref:Uncharacterized protein n=1 Tax=Glossina austeni TaxID=7395 RepID=A0A1A9V996_GLOAU
MQNDYDFITLKIVICNEVERKSRRLFETRLQVCGKVFTLNILHHNCRSKNFCSCSLYTGNASNQPLESCSKVATVIVSHSFGIFVDFILTLVHKGSSGRKVIKIVYTLRSLVVAYGAAISMLVR